MNFLQWTLMCSAIPLLRPQEFVSPLDLIVKCFDLFDFLLCFLFFDFLLLSESELEDRVLLLFLELLFLFFFSRSDSEELESSSLSELLLLLSLEEYFLLLFVDDFLRAVVRWCGVSSQ